MLTLILKSWSYPPASFYLHGQHNARPRWKCTSQIAPHLLPSEISPIYAEAKFPVVCSQPATELAKVGPFLRDILLAWKKMLAQELPNSGVELSAKTSPLKCFPSFFLTQMWVCWWLQQPLPTLSPFFCTSVWFLLLWGLLSYALSGPPALHQHFISYNENLMMLSLLLRIL